MFHLAGRFTEANPLDSRLLLIGATWLVAYGVASERGVRITIAAAVIAVGYYGYQTADAISTHRQDLGLLSAAFSPDETRLLTGGGVAFDNLGEDFALRLWDLSRFHDSVLDSGAFIQAVFPESTHADSIGNR